jgi:hypothetical protein
MPEVEMTNRPTIFLRAVFTALLAFTSVAVIPLSAEGAPGECLLAKPKTAAPAGQYWLRLGDWLTNRQCWVLRAKPEPSQAKRAAPAQAARAGARPAAAATPVRATEDAAADALSVRADPPPQPRVTGDGKVASVAAVSPAASDRADRKPSNLVQPDDAGLHDARLHDASLHDPRLPPLGQHTPEAPATALALASEPPALSTFAAATLKASQLASIEASQESASESTPAVAEPTTEARAFAAPDSLQMLLLAIFCGPAFYLLAAGTIRRLRPAEAKRRPLAYISLDDTSAHRMLLPPRLEANEDTVAS